MTTVTTEKLRAARASIQLLACQVEDVMCLALKWRRQARDERAQRLASQASSERAIEALQSRLGVEAPRATRGVPIEADAAAYVSTVEVVRAELGRLISLAGAKPAAWTVGELKRIRALTDDGTETQDAPPAVAPGGESA